MMLCISLVWLGKQGAGEIKQFAPFPSLDHKGVIGKIDLMDFW